MKLILLVPLIYILIINAENPLKNSKICGKSTCINTSKFAYKIGKTYKYEYETDILSILESNRNESKIFLKIDVHFSLKTECEGILKIMQPVLDEDDISDNINFQKFLIFAHEISKHILRFSFHDGNINEICWDENELNWVLNFKKGILSLFQNTMKRLDIDHKSTDLDINGICETNYQFFGANESNIIIKRTKDFSNCQNRYTIESSIKSEPYYFPTLRKPNIISASSQCEYVINGNIYEKIDCYELHSFKPIRNQSIGVKIQIIQKLSLKKNISDTDNDIYPNFAPITKRAQLFYYHKPIIEEAIENLKSTRDLLKQMCFYKIEDQSQFSDSFSQFIHSARLLSYTSLNKLFLRSNIICKNGKEIFIEILPFIGNNAAVLLMKNLMVNRNIASSKIYEWMLTLAMITKPNKDILIHLEDILRDNLNDSSIRLSISAITYNYCRHKSICQYDNQVQRIVKIFEKSIKNLKQRSLDDFENQKEMLINLKSLANIGIIRPTFSDEISQIIENSSIPTSIRLSAIDTYRRAQCEPTRPYFTDIYRDETINSELRIASYLQIMKCPTYAIIKTIKHTLQVEEVNQVGAFVWTHLHNLLKSASPNKIFVQSLLSDDDLERKFNNDFRKFSRNYKKSFYFDEFNAGVSVSSNLIFPTTSYLPKTLMVNFTTYLFGETVNVFQFDSRLSGFETYVESLFGPKGPYNVQNVYEKVSEYRFKRQSDQSNNENDIVKRIEQLPNQPKFKKNLKMAFGLNIFGSELFFSTFDYRLDPRSFDFFDIKKIFQKLFSKQAIEFRKTILFTDFSYSCSTSVGFPIILEGLGTSSIDMKLFKNMKANFTKENRTFDLLFDSSFNFSVNFNSKIFMDTIFTKTGVKLKADVFTTSSFNQKIIVRNGNFFVLNFSLPLKKIEIFSAKSEFYILKNKNEYIWHDSSENAIEKILCSWPFFDKIIGLKFCSNLRFPNVTKMKNQSFLISPIILRFFMNKTDDSIQSYVIKYEKIRNSTHIIFYSLGLKTEHIFETNLTHHPRRNMTNFYALFKSRSFGLFVTKGSLKNNEDEKSMDIIFDINDKQYFNSQAVLLKKGTKHGYTFYPNFYLKVNKENIAAVNGTVKLARKKGTYQYDINLTLQTKKVKMKLVSYVTNSEATLSSTLKLNYQIQSSTPQFIYTEFKITNRSTKSLTAINGNFKLQSSAYSHLDFDVILTYQKTVGHIECKIETNNASNSSKDRLGFQVIYIHYKNPDSNKLNILLSLSKLETDLDLKLQLKHEVIGSDMNSLVLIKYAEQKDISVNMHLSAPQGILLYLEGKLNVTLPTFNSMVIDGTINEKENYEYDIELKGVWFSGHNIHLRGSYEDKSSNFEDDHRLKFLIKSKSFNDITTFSYYFRDNVNAKLEIKSKYNNESYLIDLKQISKRPTETTISGELKYGPRTFSINSFLNFTLKKTVLVELHLDQMRDMQMYLKSYSTTRRKEYGIEIKLDANRDPKQKLIALFELLNAVQTNYSVIFFLSYPGRTINSVVDLEMLDYFNTNVNSRLSWSSNEAVDFQYRFAHNLHTLSDSYLIEINSVLLTPFENWTKTSYMGRFFNQRNLYSVVSDLKWKVKEQIHLKMLSNYEKNDTESINQLNCNLNSTFPKVSNLILTFDQNLNKSGLFTHFNFKYGTNKSILIRSIWQITDSSKISSLLGTIFLTTHFNNEKHGLLRTEIHFVEDGLVDCTGNLNYDNEQYLLNFEGNFEKMTSNFFYANISTPIEKYEDIEIRFGISERNKHIIAEVSNLNDTIGFEIRLFFAKLSDFDIKFSLAAPTEYFKKALLIAKIKKDNIDFQIGWNAILAGFTGVWYFNSILNFEHMYKIYIPFEKVERIGFTLKLIYDKQFDFEAYVYLVYNKLGLRIQAKPKSLSKKKTLSKRIKLIKFDEGLLRLKNNSIDYVIEIETDLIILPTIHGFFDLHKSNSLNILSGHFIFQKGNVIIYDEFFYQKKTLQNLFVMSNKLILKTPFAELEDLQINYNLNVTLNSQYLINSCIIMKKNNSVINGNFQIDYQLLKGDDNELEAHELIFKMNASFNNIPNVNFRAFLEFDDNLLGLNCTFQINNVFILTHISSEIDEGFIENSLNLQIDWPILKIHLIKLNLRKEYYEFENRTDFYIDYRPFDNHNHHKYYFQINYHFRNFDTYILTTKILTPFTQLKDMHALFNWTHNSTNNLCRTFLKLNSNVRFNISSKLNRSNFELNFVKIINNDDFLTQLKGQFQQKSNNTIKLIGKLLMPNNKEYNISGDIIWNEKYNFLKSIEIYTTPSDIQLVLNSTMADNNIKTIVQLDYFKKSLIIENDLKHFNWYQWHTKANLKVSKPLLLSKIQLNFNFKQFNHLNFDFNVSNNFEKIGYSYFKSYLKSNESHGDASVMLTNLDTRLNIKLDWIWKFLENMIVNSKNFIHINDTVTHSELKCFYRNPGKNFSNLSFGTNIQVGENWTFTTNNLFKFPNSKHIQCEIMLKVPQPIYENYYFNGSLIFDNITTYFLVFETELSNKNVIAMGQSGINDHLISCNNTLKYGFNANQVINEVFQLKKDSEFIEFYTLLKSPFFEKTTVSSRLHFNDNHNYSNIMTLISHPNDSIIFFNNIDYKSFSNMNGTFNISLPTQFKQFFGANFSVESEKYKKDYFIKLFWSHDTAILNSKYQLDETLTESNVHGLITFEFPLTTRHFSNISYGYKEIDKKIVGNTTIFYNESKVLEGKYDSVLETLMNGYYSNHVKMDVLNDFLPLGVFHEHQYPINVTEMTNLSDIKTLHVFHLYNKTKFNISGKICNQFKENGQKTQVTATAKNRTIVLNSDYLTLRDEFVQKLQLNLVESHSKIGYELNIRNETLSKGNEAHHFHLNIYYPLRNFSLTSSYQISEFNITSNSFFKWTKYGRQKCVGSSFNFLENPIRPINKKIVFNIHHPSFIKNVSFETEIYRNFTKLIDLLTVLIYSNNPEKELRIFTEIDNKNSLLYKLNITHPATNLLINMDGIILLNLKYYLFKNVGQYKRTYLPTQSGELFAQLDLINYKMELKKRTLRDLTFLLLDYNRSSSTHKSNLAFIYGPTINASGHLTIHLNDKRLDFHLNKTTDESQSVHLIGQIPDARSAKLDLWRDYDDTRIYDVSYFMRLNHSRLLISKLNWRTELRQDVQDLLKELFLDMYENFLENLDYWRHYIRSESIESLNDIWLDAKPIVQELLNDISGLKVIEDDFEQFKIFFNSSYNANEFYIKDIIDTVMYVTNELSKRSKIENLPAVFTEIWEVLGDSGEVIRRSITWFIKTTKTSYRKIVEISEMIIRGDLMVHMSTIMENFIQKYDTFIKNLHVNVLEFIEEFIHSFFDLFLDKWNLMLKTAEPTFIKVIHYLETIVYRTSKQFLDFLYKRKAEIIESKYFNQFAKFAQDIDLLYRDFMSNDMLTNLSKYSKKFLKFAKNKYFKFIPFANELSNIGMEIYNEIQLLQKLPSIQYLIEKYNELYDHFMWIFDYFDVGNKMGKFITLVHSKFSEISLSALEAENKHRKAKTKFTFDLKNGFLQLEQKIPISWHAFNETPKFEEIPEYKIITRLQSYFSLSNTTFWTLYYQFRQYTDPSELMPPFKAYAMLVAKDNFLTFDRKLYEFSGNCQYLLANDFHKKTFFLIVDYDQTSTNYKYVMSIDSQFIEIDIFNQRISIGDNSLTKLPYKCNNTYIYQESSVITIGNKMGLIFRCNLKFNTCILELSGWYFGKTAGLLGTMNNERFDDFYPVLNKTETSLMQFTEYWNLKKDTCTSRHFLCDLPIQKNDTIREFCTSLFGNRLSQFQPCFSIIDPMPFKYSCLKSSMLTNMCTIIMSYIEVCAIENTPLRLPSICVQCQLVNGSAVYEGDFVRFQGESVPRSADIVFIVEAKSCNDDIKKRRNIHPLINLLNKELIHLNITSNRYSLVLFGGNEIFNEPRSVVIQNQIFTNHSTIPLYFDDIQIGNGSSDIFYAISFASKLIYRPGVKKIFILIPCSSCDIYNKMNLDYNVVNQMIFDNDVTLHILMNDDFQTDKIRIRKNIFGIDRHVAYTKKDSKLLVGDPEIRNEVKIRPLILNYCSFLAIESNGSIFSAIKLEQNKKFPSVFAKRVAVSARPTNCQTCECISDDNGISFMECYSCNYQIPAITEFDFDNDALHLFNPLID